MTKTNFKWEEWFWNIQ